jgi:glycosyltransferase involved in cell wall biosynthesis
MKPISKILLVNTRHFHGGGDSTYTFNLSDLLRSQGYEVAFFAMQDERNLPDANADLFVSHIDFKELNQHKDVWTGLRILSRVIYSHEARQKFTRLMDRFQPDVIHLQNIHAHITPSVILEAKKRGLPVVWTLHDYKLICPNTHFLIDTIGEICEACGKGAYYQPLLKRCKKGSLMASGMAALEAYAHRLMRIYEQVDAFLTPSSFLRNKLISRGFPPKKVHHLPLFIPDALFQDSGPDARYLLFLSKLDPIKGIYPLLDACRQSPGVKLILAGRIEEPLAGKLMELLPANAQYVGLKHGEELRQLLQSALAVVVPSLWYENQPFSILEAFACAKPVIASDLGGMTELVLNKERGLLVSPGNVEALAEAMRWMASHPKEALNMGKVAQEYVRTYHSPEQHYQRLMELYAKVRGEIG